MGLLGAEKIVLNICEFKFQISIFYVQSASLFI